MSDQAPPLSVILATTEPWPHARDAIDALDGQTRAAGGELIVADGDGAGLPPDAGSETYPGMVVVRDPGASVFALRAQAAALARGEVIAFTEDHCLAPPDWCERILNSHAEHPSAPAIGGAVENGSTETVMDWANFLITFGAFVPPVRADQRERCPAPANLSYKRATLPGERLAPGWMEYELNPDLFVRGEMIVDDRIRLVHIQPTSLRRACVMNFHNGRSTSGMLAAGRPWRERRRMLRVRLGRPLNVFRETLRTVRGKPSVRRQTAEALPLLALLALCHGAGEYVGCLAGPGASPERLV